MPAKWSKYDDQRLPNPKDSKDGDQDPGKDPGPSKRLVMNWTTPNTPKPPDKKTSGGGGDGSGGGGGGGSTDPDKTDPDKVDVDSSYWNPNLIGLLPAGTPYHRTPPDYDRLEVETDDLSAYEQNMLTAAGNLVNQFNSLRDRAQNVLSEEIWGRGEGNWYHQHPNNQNKDNVDMEPHFIPTSSAIAARDFTKSFGPTQQGSLQGTADMITLSGMFIEVLDVTVSSYAQMDMLAVFPDPQELKKT
jgi:hypothetical protein